MSGSFSAMGAYLPASFPLNLSGHGEPVRVDGIMAGAGVFNTLAVGPAVGRGFTAEDECDGADGVVLLSDGLATTLFGASAGAVGTHVRLDDRPYTIVGVMPPGFAFPFRDIPVWMPIRGIPPAAWASRSSYMLHVVARLRPGLSVSQARARRDVRGARLERAYLEDNAGVGVAVVPLRDVVAPGARMLVLAVFGAVFGAAFCLMLIACANLAIAPTVYARRSCWPKWRERSCCWSARGCC